MSNKEHAISAQNGLAKTPEIPHSCNPVRAPEMHRQRGAITPEIGGALMPEIDNCVHD
jgi:hypothetical protein